MRLAESLHYNAAQRCAKRRSRRYLASSPGGKSMRAHKSLFPAPSLSLSLSPWLPSTILLGILSPKLFPATMASRFPSCPGKGGRDKGQIGPRTEGTHRVGINRGRSRFREISSRPRGGGDKKICSGGCFEGVISALSGGTRREPWKRACLGSTRSYFRAGKVAKVSRRLHVEKSVSRYGQGTLLIFQR